MSFLLLVFHSFSGTVLTDTVRNIWVHTRHEWVAKGADDLKRAPCVAAWLAATHVEQLAPNDDRQNNNRHQPEGRSHTVLLCIWGIGTDRVRDVYTVMERTEGRQWVDEHILSVAPVMQVNGRRRFNVHTRRRHKERVMVVLQSMFDSVHVREHVQYDQRDHHLVPRSNSARVASAHILRVGSLNIAGVASKRTELQLMCDQQKLDVIALQETNRRANHWSLTLPGYQFIDRPVLDGVVGSHGLAVGVCLRRGLTAYSVGRDSAYIMTVRIFNVSTFEVQRLDQAGVMISCVYKPTNCGGASVAVRQEVFRHIREVRTKHPNTPHIVVGDWNWEANVLQRWMTTAGCNAVSAIQVAFPEPAGFLPRFSPRLRVPCFLVPG